MNYGPVWVDLNGTSVLDVEIPILQHKNTGGVLLFTKNYINVKQIKDFVKHIRDIAGKQLIIAVDHEGGRIWRFNEGFSKPIAPQKFGDLYKHDPEQAIQHLELAGEVIAHELLNCGIDLSFAPVLDIDTGVSTVIGDRSYSTDPWIATNCARAFIRGLNKQGMRAVGKHFPGHGGCVMDSHFTAAIDTRSLEQIEALDLLPFAKLHQELAGIMPAHVVYSAIDAKPAGFSTFWLQNILRQKIGFKGAIISDCLSMLGSGFADKIADGAQLALDAGCDMVITSQQTRETLLDILNNINWQMSDDQIARIAALAGDFANPALRKQPTIIQEIISA